MLRFSKRALQTAATETSLGWAQRSVPQTRISRLSNGFTIATEATPGSQTASVGVFIDAGSRFETPETNGAAHFCEHMFFKGSAKTSQLALETGIENMVWPLVPLYIRCFSID